MMGLVQPLAWRLFAQLRTGARASGMLLVCTCWGCGGAAPPGRTAAESRIELLSADAEVWGFEVAVRGRVHGSQPPSACRLQVGPRELSAELSGASFGATVPLETGINRVSARCRMPDGRTLEAPPVQYTVRLAHSGELQSGPPAGPPSWLPAAVVYGVIPPLFGSPPLAAVTDALDELDELGVTALWLSPIFESPPDDYGYAVTDPFDVRDEYGSEEDLRALVEAAHARELRILLDLVPNHTSDHHPYYMQAERLGRRSHYYAFYERDDEGQVTHYFDWENLPNLDYDNPEVERYTIESALHWIRTADVDGFRVDAAWGIRQRDASFWPRFSGALKAKKPELFLLAEASARDAYYVTHGFDAAYDWSEELGHHAWEHVFDGPEGIAQRLDAAVNRAESGLHRVFRFLNNNDTGARFITRHGEPLTRVATAALLTLPGIPCLYSFDEVGAEFQPYDEAAPVQRENPGLRAFHQQLIALRRAQPALHGSGFTPLHVGKSDEAYVYARFDEASGAAALVALNFSDRPASVQVTVPAALRGKRLEDALGARRARADAQGLSPALAPWDVMVLLPATAK